MKDFLSEFDKKVAEINSKRSPKVVENGEISKGIPPGTKVRLPGIPVEVTIASKEECANPRAIRIASTKADWLRLKAEGCPQISGVKDGFFCNVCNVEIVLAPSGQEIHAMGGMYTCMDCVLKTLNEKEHN